MTTVQQPRSHFLAHPLGRRPLGEGEDGGEGDKLAIAWTMKVALGGMNGPLSPRFWITRRSALTGSRGSWLLALGWGVRSQSVRRI